MCSESMHDREERRDIGEAGEAQLVISVEFVSVFDASLFGLRDGVLFPVVRLC